MMVSVLLVHLLTSDVHYSKSALMQMLDILNIFYRVVK